MATYKGTKLLKSDELSKLFDAISITKIKRKKGAKRPTWSGNIFPWLKQKGFVVRSIKECESLIQQSIAAIENEK